MDELKYSGFACSPVTGKRHEINHLSPASEWCDVYQIEHLDEARGGQFGLANLQAQQLTNRTQYTLNLLANLINIVSQQTEVLNILSNRIDTSLALHTQYLESILEEIRGGNTPTETPITTIKKYPLMVSNSTDDSNSAYIQVDQDIKGIPILSLESGQVFSFDSGDISLQAGSTLYYFSSDQSETIPPVETLPPIDTLPIDIPTIDPIDTMSADDEFDDTITDQDIDDIIKDIYGDNSESTADDDIVSLVSDIYN